MDMAIAIPTPFPRDHQACVEARPGPEVDGIENESLEFAAQIDAYRLLAGPANLFGKQYSSETGATTVVSARISPVAVRLATMCVSW